MSRDRRLVAGSKKLSWLLRHGASEAGLAMDAAGWATCDDVLRLTALSVDELEEVVLRNNKSRFQLDGDRIRASQGHSLLGMPVTREALEASWTVYESGPTVVHGTTVEAAESIAVEGIKPGGRTHVHLAATPDSVVGKRFHTPFLLKVSVERVRSTGREVFVSPNGVVLIRDVPAACIVGLIAQSKSARRHEERLRRLLRL